MLLESSYSNMFERVLFASSIISPFIFLDKDGACCVRLERVLKKEQSVI